MTEQKYYNTPSYHHTSPTGSRRAKVEQKKLMNQTLVFGALSLGILVFFGLVVIPGVIRFFGKSTVNLNSDADVPPQIPLLSAPVQATSSAEIPLKGFNEAGNTIVILNNGSETSREAVKEDGSFSITVRLQEGENRLSAYAVNQSGKESAVTNQYSVELDTTPPKLEIQEPQENQSIQGKKDQNLTVKGTSDPKTRVYLNDRLLFSKEDGSFTSTFRLANGENRLLFKAIDEAGNITEKEILVTFAE